jgi:hypothetical protein
MPGVGAAVLPWGEPPHRTDLEADLGTAGEVGQQFLDPRQVAAADFFHYEGIGRVQHEAILARPGLQRLEPCVHILGRQFGFEAFQATRPDIHYLRNLVDRPAEQATARCGRNALWIKWEQGSLPRAETSTDGTCSARRLGRRRTPRLTATRQAR